MTHPNDTREETHHETPRRDDEVERSPKEERPDIVDEVLIEEVGIDGMCGVY